MLWAATVSHNLCESLASPAEEAQHKLSNLLLFVRIAEVTQVSVITNTGRTQDGEGGHAIPGPRESERGHSWSLFTCLGPGGVVVSSVGKTRREHKSHMPTVMGTAKRRRSPPVGGLRGHEWGPE